jgi:hypothetical protein
VEWVYNAADIDAAKAVWARDMGTADNEELIRYSKGRQVWLVKPDEKPPSLSPYASVILLKGVRGRVRESGGLQEIAGSRSR